MTDLLVSYQCGHFGKARREALRVLRGLGDDAAGVERTAVDGIALARTALDGRKIVHHCRELSDRGYAFEHAIKWVPVDHWCNADLDSIRRLLVEKVRERIAPEDTWGMEVAKRRWQRYHTQEIVTNLAGAIDRKVDLDQPDWLVRVDVIGREAAVSVLRAGEVFSAAAPVVASAGTPRITPAEGSSRSAREPPSR
jgi:tRNA acetyltransferase TAN1